MGRRKKYRGEVVDQEKHRISLENTMRQIYIDTYTKQTMIFAENIGISMDSLCDYMRYRYKDIKEVK